MLLFGKDMKRTDILRRVGDISQLGGVRLYDMAEGPQKGVRTAEIKNASGLDMRVLIDRGMDISDLRYNSIPLAWKSSVKETSAAYYDQENLEWLRTFYGGFLLTCGLVSAGAPSRDGNEEFGLHGRVANIAAENICIEKNWEGDDYFLSIKGTVRETRVFGENLELTRTIKLPMDRASISINDTVENIGFRKTPVMILYHMNMGFPLLDASSRIIEPGSGITPMTEIAEKGLDSALYFNEPLEDFQEQVFCHDIPPDKKGFSNIALVNEDFQNGTGLGVWLKFNKDSLPYLNEWKQTGFGEYVCGLEPANCRTYGRKTSREKGELQFLEPGEKKEFSIEVEILKNVEDIRNAVSVIEGLK